MLRFLKDWILAVAIIVGASAYFCYAHSSVFDPVRPYAADVVAYVQPILLFMMLFLSFCKVNPHDLHFTRWHLWLLLFQSGVFILLGVALWCMPFVSPSVSVLVQSAMLCLICPTATAAAVVTDRLGGNVPSIVTYTMLINIANAVVIPLIAPVVRAATEQYSFLTMSWMILSRVLPMLVLPLFLAWFVRYAMPRIHAMLLRPRNLAFYLWCVSLSLAIAVSTRSLVRSEHGMHIALLIAAVSFVCCLLQFMLGKIMGHRYASTRHFDDEQTSVTALTAGQALGQKNTIFIIWVAYSFFDPLTSLAGGFYSIWHNIYNSWQMAHHKQ